ncbi:MAG: glycosyltransferase family 4 protein [Planctomycetota bacterium]|nr:glycosyltransferase family 4 protein [Planctomycetota bacterium]
MKVLHLFSNVKLTGPAETVLLICKHLKKMGVQVYFACGRYVEGERSSLERRADEYGVEPLTSFILRKHFDLVSSVKDIPEVEEFIDKEGIDIVHTHLNGDHIVGGWAARKSRRKPSVVRTVHSLGSLLSRWRVRYLTKAITDAVVVPSNWHKKRAEKVWRTSPLLLMEPPVDLERFDATRGLGRQRERFGLSDADFAVGVVARVQKKRRFQIFLEAIRLAYEKRPQVRGVVIGRGTHIETVAVKPAQKMGLSEVVKFTGYHTGDDYVAAIGALDVKVYLVTGTDETARALREALCMGKPAIVSNRGMLGEIVKDGMTGFVVEERPDAIAEKIIRVVDDKELYKSLSSAAVQDVRSRFSPDEYAKKTLNLYEDLLKKRRI